MRRCSLLLCLLAVGCLTPVQPGPEPLPTGELAKISEQCPVVYRRLLGDVYAEAAEKLRAEKWTDRQFGEWSKARTTEARKAAFQPFEQWFQENLSGDKWDAEKAAEACEEAARGFHQ